MTEAVGERAVVLGERESDELDKEVISWWMLHKSELNTLSLNRLVEGLRTMEDRLAIPPWGRIRGEREYRAHVTFQFAIELELADPTFRATLAGRPHLRWAAVVDAAYYISRQWPGLLQQPAEGDKAVQLDLRDAACPAFRRYLVSRMNLFEEEAPDSKRSPSERDASRREWEDKAIEQRDVQLLWDLCRSIASTLAHSPNAEKVKERWQKCEKQNAKDTMTKASDVVFRTLLVGPAASLLVLQPQDKVAAGVTAPGPGPTEERHGNLIYEWRNYASARADTPDAIASEAGAPLGIIRTFEARVGPCMSSVDEPGAGGGPIDGLVFRALADVYGVLPSSPSWSQVQDARSAMEAAANGIGNVSSLRSKLDLLREFAELLDDARTVGAVCRFIFVATALARRSGAPFDEALRRAMKALSDGRGLPAMSKDAIDEHLREFQVALASTLGSNDVLRWTDEADPQPTLADLRDAVKAAETMVPTDGPRRRRIADAAWRATYRRLDVSGSSPLAEAAEIVCAVDDFGPCGAVLDIASMTPRKWTHALLVAVRRGTAEQSPGAYLRVFMLRLLNWLDRQLLVPTPAVSFTRWVMSKLAAQGTEDDAARLQLGLLSYALHALGMRSLQSRANEDLPIALELAGFPLRAAQQTVAAHRDWMAQGTSSECVLLVTTGTATPSDGWEAAPERGLLLVTDRSEALELIDGAIGTWLGRFASSVRIVWEGREITKDTRAALERKLASRFSSKQWHSLRLMSSDTPTQTDLPPVYASRGPDDLWS